MILLALQSVVVASTLGSLALAFEIRRRRRRGLSLALVRTSKH